MAHYSEISVRQAQELMSGDYGTMVLDARDEYSYKEGHIDGAMQAHSGLIEHLLKQQDYERPVVVYCYQGNSSKDLAEIFGRAGFKYAYSMKGGYTSWKKRDSLYCVSAYSIETNAWLEREGFEKQTLNGCIEGQTSPLILACRQGELSIVRELIASGADLDQKDGDANTALWAACYGDHLDIMSILLDSGANVDHQNDDGVSVLIYAASAGKTEAVALLVDRGANCHLQTADDFTALDLAANAKILKQLKSLDHQLV